MAPYDHSPAKVWHPRTNISAHYVHTSLLVFHSPPSPPSCHPLIFATTRHLGTRRSNHTCWPPAGRVRDAQWQGRRYEFFPSHVQHVSRGSVTGPGVTITLLIIAPTLLRTPPRTRMFRQFHQNFIAFFVLLWTAISQFRKHFVFLYAQFKFILRHIRRRAERRSCEQFRRILR